MTSLNDDAVPVSEDTPEGGPTDSQDVAADEPTAKQVSGAASRDLDRWLNRGIIVALVLIVAVGAYFAYAYYAQQQAQRLASPALRLVDQVKVLVDKTPNDAALRIRYGEALFAAGDVAGAKGQLAVGLKLNPKLAAAYQDLAQIAMSQNDYSGAETALKRLLDMTSTGDMQNVNDRRDFALFSLGEVMLAQKRYTDAIGYFNQAIVVNKSAADSYLRLAQAYHGTGDDGNAFAKVTIALAFDPKYAEALYFRGTLFLAQGNKGAAAADFRASMDVAPDRPEPAKALAALGSFDTWFKQAQTAFASGDMATALNAARVARALNPGSFEAQMLTGQILIQQKDYANAVIAYQKTVDLQPTNAAAKAALKAAQALSKTGSNS